MRAASGTVGVDRGWTKVARVEAGESDWSTKEGGLECGSCGRARMVGDKGRSRKLRVTLEKR